MKEHNAFDLNSISACRSFAKAIKVWKPAVLCASLFGATFLAGISAASAAPVVVKAIGVENQYADVISQIGGKYVQVTAIESDPNTDPHTFEVSPKIAGQIAAAGIVVKNGLGYDSWADKIIAAAPNTQRKVIDVQQLLGLPDSTSNPHLWYQPKTMPAVAHALAEDLSALMPEQAGYFQANEKKFDESLKPWFAAIDAFKAHHPNTPIAVTEPVADYLLQALGMEIKTPFSMEAAVMNGTDPSPQDVAKQNALFNEKKVKVFAYNQQVTDALTQSFLALAKKNGIPVVGVYETMPTPGFTYQSWMAAEVKALDNALTHKISTVSLHGGK